MMTITVDLLSELRIPPSREAGHYRLKAAVAVIEGETSRIEQMKEGSTATSGTSSR